MIDEQGIRAMLPPPRVKKNETPKTVTFSEPLEIEQSPATGNYDSYLDKPLFDTDVDHPLRSRKPALIPNEIGVNTQPTAPPQPIIRQTAQPVIAQGQESSSRFFVYAFAVFSLIALLAIFMYMFYGTDSKGPGTTKSAPATPDTDVNDLLKGLR